MVESNHDEERLARIEYLLETIQREQIVAKTITAKLVKDVAVLVPQVAALTSKR